MPDPQDVKADKNWLLVVDKIKARYNEYCLKDGKKYHPIPFNSTPEPYQRLIDSFKEELSFQLGKSETEVSGMIPSASLFAEIFRTYYAPKGEKLHACYLYATGKSKTAFEQDEIFLSKTGQPVPVIVSRSTVVTRFKPVYGLLILSCVLVSLSFFIYQHTVVASPSGLVIKQPASGKTVPRRLLVEGTVLHADKVWIVVCDVRDTVYHGAAYYVQVPIKVASDGTWKGEIFIGGINKAHIGAKVVVRAFVNPKVSLSADERLYSWPEAELSSAGINVVRGYYESDFTSGLTLKQPVSNQVLPQKTLAEGKVDHADFVWIIIHDLTSGGYHVQSPGKVEANGSWRAPIYVGAINAHPGAKFQIRVFVSPVDILQEGTVLPAWPKAQFSTEAISVFR